MNKQFTPEWLRVAVAIDPGGCWVWRLRKNRRGYGKINVGGRSGRHGYAAHRAFYERFRGPIPDGMFVLHKCDNSSCVNPEHLDVGDHAENMTQMVSRGRVDPRHGVL